MVDGQTTYERDVLPFIRPFSVALLASLQNVPLEAVSHFDHGSGTGEVLRALDTPTMAARVVALEPNPTMSNRFTELYGSYNSVSLYIGTLENYLATDPALDFDVVTSQLVLPFVPDPFREL